jgi:membrane associated rhomboid family serine protease
MNAPVTLVLVIVTALVSWQAWERPRMLERLLLWPSLIDRRKEYDRLLTHGFIHADLMHLAFNMITLYSFGAVMERYFSLRIGAAGYLFFYLSAVVFAALPGYMRHRNHYGYRSLGASGAVSAVLFSSILLDPWSLIFVFFIPVPAFLFGGLYIWYSYWMDRRGGDRIDHGAHLWGALYGLMFTLLQQPQLAGHFLRRLFSPGFGLG